jgi:alkylation response protein AidB-like acyl-CoA dehydrogenase
MNDVAALNRTDAERGADCLRRVRTLAARIATAADEIEAKRELPADLVAALHDAGLFRMLLPRSLGGEELPLALYVQVIEEIAKSDASTAWCVAQTSGCSVLAAAFPAEVAHDLFGKDPHALLAWGPPNVSGKAVAAEGGFRISGTWHFASGSRHATWMGAHCPVFEADGKPRLNADGTPVEITVVFPRASASIKDVWHVIGLKGTGSDSYSVSDLFVPQQRTVTAFARNIADKREGGPLYKFTTFQMFGATFASVALGIARTTLDAFVELAKSKVPYGAKYLLRDNAVIQARIGVGEAQLASGRLFLLDAIEEMWAGALAGGFTLEQRVRLRMASAFATHAAREVVDACYHAAGATAIFESNPFERRFRDVHTVSQQVQAHYSVFEAIGQHYLGLPLHPRLI